MVRGLANAIEILEESQARFYSIIAPGIKKSYGPETDEHTSKDALEQFQKDWEKLTPGVYTVTHKTKKSDNASKEFLRFQKNLNKTKLAA